MSLQINLAALTEGELLGLYGAEEMQAKLSAISRARMDNRVLLDLEIPAAFPQAPLPEVAGRVWGMTTEQSQALARKHAQLTAENAVLSGNYLVLDPAVYARAYLLGDSAIAVYWSETSSRMSKPETRVLTWLRDRASGLACVLTTDAASIPVPTPSEEMDTHAHPDVTAQQLIALHQQQVLRLGRPMKLAQENPWVTAWQAAYDLNLVAWKRRNVVVETP